MALLAIVPPDEWISRTNLLLSSRSPELKEVDRAYAEYHKTRSEEKGLALHEALSKYLRKHGDYWDKSERNKKSGGLMRYIHEATRPDDRGARALKARIPETRYGVLHLWSNTHVQTQWGMLALEGALSLANPVLDVVNGVGKLPDSQDWLSETKLGVTVGKGGAGYVRGKRTADENPATPAPTPPPPPRPLIRQVSAHDLGNGSAPEGAIRRFFGAAYDAAKNAVETAILAFVAKIKTNQGIVTRITGRLVQKLALHVLEQTCAAAAPFVGAGMDLGRGVVQTVGAIKDRVQTARARSKFYLAPGHPALIAHSIEEQMNWNIGRGLYSTIKGGAKLAGNVFTAGASAIVDVIAAALELVFKLLMRHFEGEELKAWLAEVRSVCPPISTEARVFNPEDPTGQRPPPPIVNDEKEFNRLFERGCEATVCVPMLTLNSGICGDQMMFMRMFDDAGVIVQDTFNAATDYFTRLKRLGSNYVRETGFRFSSPIRVVQGYLWHAINNHAADNISFGDGLVKFLS